MAEQKSASDRLIKQIVKGPTFALVADQEIHSMSFTTTIAKRQHDQWIRSTIIPLIKDVTKELREKKRRVQET